MLNSLKIQNFKAIENLEIPELGQINLITGKNNTSKTSLLEAVSILVSGFDLEWVFKLIKDRNELVFNEITDELDIIRSLQTLFTDYQIDVLNPKFIGSDSQFIIFNFQWLITNKQGEVSLSHPLFSSELNLPTQFVFSIGNKENSISINVKDFPVLSMGKFFSDKLGSNNFQFINSSLQDDETNAKLWDKLVFSENKKYVLQVLHIIHKEIEQIDFIVKKNKRNAVVKIKNKKDVLSLKSMGDGVNRILTIALSMVNAENGYLFIDEFENGLHYSIQVRLWEVIFFLAKELNVQVFVTTHSSDTVSAFSMVTSENENVDLGKVIKLQRKNDALKAIIFSHEDLKIANEQDLNLR